MKKVRSLIQEGRSPFRKFQYTNKYFPLGSILAESIMSVLQGDPGDQ
jgi:hypothetical protein